MKNSKIPPALFFFLVVLVLISCIKKETIVFESELEEIDECFIENDARHQYIGKVYKVEVPVSTVDDVYGYSASISQNAFNSLNRQEIYFRFMKGRDFIQNKISHYESLSSAGLLNEMGLEYLNQLMNELETNEDVFCKRMYFQVCDSLGGALYSSSFNLGNMYKLKNEYKFLTKKHSPVTMLSNIEECFDYAINLSKESCKGNSHEFTEGQRIVNKGCTGTTYGFSYCLFDSNYIIFNYKVSWDSNSCNYNNGGVIEFEAVAEVVN